MKKSLLTTFTLALAALGTNAQTCSDLIISKYVSMGANNKCIEIYNTSTSTITLTNVYYIARYKTPTASGVVSGPVPTMPAFSDTFRLKGTIAAGATMVICNPETTPNTSNSGAICDPALQAHADVLGNIYGTYGSSVGDPTYFKGSDAITIEKVVGGSPVLVDILGRFGDYMASSTGASSAWSTTAPHTGGTGMGTWITKGYMMVRKPTVLGGVSTNPSAFNPLSQYDTITKPANLSDTLATWNLLGSHACNCPLVGVKEIESNSRVNIYPNPITEATANVTFEATTTIYSVAVYNIEGKLFTEKILSKAAKKTEVAFANLPRGLYVVKLTYTDGKQEVKRITKD